MCDGLAASFMIFLCLRQKVMQSAPMGALALMVGWLDEKIRINRCLIGSPDPIDYSLFESVGSIRGVGDCFAIIRPRIVRALDLCGQAIKGAWGMSWYQVAMKGVKDCEKLGGAVK